MPKPPVSHAAAQFLTLPNHATIAVVRQDGQPVTYPTWYLFENGQIVVNMDAGRKRIEHLRNDPRVSLSAMGLDNWVDHVTVIGHVAEWVDDPDLADIDRISRHYTDSAYSARDRPRITARIDVDRWYGWGKFKGAS